MNSEISYFILKPVFFRLYAAVMVDTAVQKTLNVRCPQGSV